ncbi:hypothetical protein, partial [Vreelandella olivaria]|uniref:hypothetical protein n=1 Tax=Vreelandella olivaria TaxID=390919 RepID=UPI00201F92C7
TRQLYISQVCCSMFGRVPAWLRRPLNLPATGEALKRRTGVEASQAVHGLRTATQGFRQFEIPTVSEAITRVGLAAKLTSIGSAVGLGWIPTRPVTLSPPPLQQDSGG